MAESTHVSCEFAAGTLVATIRAEKVGDYEAGIIGGEIKGQLARAKPRLVLDMTSVMLLSSAGIGMLLDLHRACHSAGGKFAMCSLDSDILGSLRATKIERLFTIRPDRASALELMA